MRPRCLLADAGQVDAGPLGRVEVVSIDPDAGPDLASLVGKIDLHCKHQGVVLWSRSAATRPVHKAQVEDETICDLRRDRPNEDLARS